MSKSALSFDFCGIFVPYFLAPYGIVFFLPFIDNFVSGIQLFIAASIIDRQPLVLAGSLVFLLACLFFLIPLVNSLRRVKSRGND